jgi:hypothetical protein
MCTSPAEWRVTIQFRSSSLRVRTNYYYVAHPSKIGLEDQEPYRINRPRCEILCTSTVELVQVSQASAKTPVEMQVITTPYCDKTRPQHLPRDTASLAVQVLRLRIRQHAGGSRPMISPYPLTISKCTASLNFILTRPFPSISAMFLS